MGGHGRARGCAPPRCAPRRSSYGANTMVRPTDCSPRPRCQTYRRCSDLDRPERDPDMSVQPRHSLLRTRTMCAAFFVFAATALIPRVAAANIQICHRPPGNPTNAHEISVSEQSIPAHIAHGDLLGACMCSSEAEPCGTGFAPCCPGSKCVPDPTGTTATCVAASSSNPMPVGGACTNSTQCDALNPCTSVGTNDSVCGG